MKKKLLALALAGVMTFGASLTAFAADATVDNTTTSEAEITGTGSMNLPTIKVTVPTSFNVVLNPFQIAYTVDDVVYKTQIVTVPQLIANESDVAVAVNVSEFKATPEGDAKLAAKSVGKLTDKSVYLYLEIVNSASDNAGEAKFTGSGLVPTTDGDGAKKDAVITLAAKSDTVPKTYAAFKLGGDMVVNPVNADGAADPWVAADKIGVSFKLTFTPQMASGK